MAPKYRQRTIVTLLSVMAIAFASSYFFPAVYPVCSFDEHTRVGNCVGYHFGPSLIVGVWVWVDAHNGFVTAMASVVVAAFTGVLWVVTKKSVETAKTAADALSDTERAYVYPVITNLGAISECIRTAKVYYLGNDSSDADRPCPETCELTFQFKNFGKTPAVLKKAFVAFGLFPLGAEVGVTVQEGILGAAEATADLFSQMNRGLSRNEAVEVLTYTKHIAFLGQVLFEDIWGNEYRTRFHYSWVHPENRMQLCNLEIRKTASRMQQAE